MQPCNVTIKVMPILVEAIIYLGIILTTFFWWPTAPVPFEVTKVVFFQYFVKILALVFVYSFLTKYKKWNINGWLISIILAFAIWATVASVLGVNVVKSFAGNYYRNDGLLTFYHLLGFSLIISFFWKEDLKKRLSLAFFSSSLILSAISLYEIVTGKFGLGTAATFGNPNFLAGYLAVALPFSFYLFKESGNKLYLLGLSVVSVAIVLIGANAATLTLILFLAFCAVLYLKSRFKKFIIVSLLFLFVLVIGIWARNYYLANSKSLVAEGRVRIIVNVVLGFTQRPILGYGWANVDKAFENGNWPIKFNNDVYVDKAHSEILEILATTGVSGLIIYLAFLGLVFKSILFNPILKKDKLWRFTLLSLLVLYLFHAQTNVTSIAEQLIFWLVVGISLTV